MAVPAGGRGAGARQGGGRLSSAGSCCNSAGVALGLLVNATYPRPQTHQDITCLASASQKRTTTALLHERRKSLWEEVAARAIAAGQALASPLARRRDPRKTSTLAPLFPRAFCALEKLFYLLLFYHFCGPLAGAADTGQLLHALKDGK